MFTLKPNLEDIDISDSAFIFSDFGVGQINSIAGIRYRLRARKGC